jgi:hypothetical protein
MVDFIQILLFCDLFSSSSRSHRRLSNFSLDAIETLILIQIGACPQARIVKGIGSSNQSIDAEGIE